MLEEANNKIIKKGNKNLIITVIMLCIIIIVAIIFILTKNNTFSNYIVGTWKYDGSLDYIYEFKNDNTCTYAEMSCTYSLNDSKIEILFDGWDEPLEGTIDGNKLTMKDSFDNDVVYYKQ